MIKVGSLCSTACVENIKVVDKKEVPLGPHDVATNTDWHTFRFLKTSGSATESGIIKYC